MSTTRQQVMSAVLNLITSMTFSSPIGNKTTWASPPTERLKLWGDVDASMQPACFLVTHRETDEYRNLGLLRRRLDLGAWCYCRASDSAPGQTSLDLMMEAFEATFIQPNNFSTNALTLGGLVYWCRIEGRVVKVPGDIDSQAMLVVPIVVEMP